MFHLQPPLNIYEEAGRSFILNINHYAEPDPCAPRLCWQHPWGQYCPWEQLCITECPTHGREDDVSCEQPHLLLQSLLRPGIPAAETWDDPGWTRLPSVPPRIAANQHSWLGADEHLSMHLSALQRMRPSSRNLISKYSTQGRHCCMASHAARLEMARSLASNMA